MKKILVLILLVFNINNALAKSCIDSDLVIAATGDTIFHGSLFVQAFKNDSRGDFNTFWKDALPYLQQADLMYTNLEGPVAPGLFPNGKIDMSLAETYHPSNGMYSVGEAGKSYTFNFHPQSLRALVKAGFTLYSTANNHTLDRGLIGLNKTIEILSELNVNKFGTKLKTESDDHFVSVLNKNGFNLAFISCTYGNNNSIKTNQVLNCYNAKLANPQLLALVEKYSKQVDAVVVTPHWGSEYSEKFSSKQNKLATSLVGSGAKAIIGHHPHVVQPLKYIKNDKGVKVPVLYSLGNFVTNQAPSNWKDPVKNESRFKRRVGASAFIGFKFNDGELIVNEVKLLPTYMKIQYEGEPGIRKLVPAYPQLYQGQKGLVKSLKKAQAHFLNSFKLKDMISYEQLGAGVVCQ